MAVTATNSGYGVRRLPQQIESAPVIPGALEHDGAMVLRSFPEERTTVSAVRPYREVNQQPARTERLSATNLVYLRERRENSVETDSRTRNGPANNFRGGKEPRSSESLMD
jgi:hypothetical protein